VNGTDSVLLQTLFSAVLNCLVLLSKIIRLVRYSIRYLVKLLPN
jgi:hypothetical protein